MVDISSALTAEPGALVRVLGRVVAFDATGFILQDATGRIQVEGEANAPTGTWIEVTGSRHGDALQAAALHPLTRPQTDFPQHRGDWARLHDEGQKRIGWVRTRAELLREIRDFFHEASFVEVQTASRVPNPGMDPHLHAFRTEGGPTPRWLATSPEYQMKRLLSAGMTRIYQLAPSFRRDESGAQHEPEFTMLEWYRAGSSSDAVMRDTEALVARLATRLHGEARLPNGVDLTPPWPRMRVAEVYERCVGESFDPNVIGDEVFFERWVERVEPRLGLEKPVFITHWPARMASLARVFPDEPSWADRFEAYVSGAELCNGFGELVCAIEQRRRFEVDLESRRQRGLDQYPIDEAFLRALEEGIPPSGGNALGVDRLIALLVGAEKIQDVIAIPDAHL